MKDKKEEQEEKEKRFPKRIDYFTFKIFYLFLLN